MATQPTALIAKHAVGAIDERIGDRRQVREQEQEPRHEGDGGCPREDLQNVAITRKLLQAANQRRRDLFQAHRTISNAVEKVWSRVVMGDVLLVGAVRPACRLASTA